ncbi:lipopolysaccharide transport periplasmic protein LptA [Desulfobulbus sp. US1]|nr:lipopolysaccharide transport periplasmic protein LptA [Desulfobulbus sp. N2]MCW5207914.1 lipopolysaccharide transport periplasmic protein LptA [Desulfobulbus sp. US2]MCW5208648.1 lipopolysaccharide transport periplasmic protein LptA [Desulfobulbus sp. US1]MCW5214091.1 lipopolysaccharide transport periplasmic protein LptA [Desulfobulbus sp. US5]
MRFFLSPTRKILQAAIIFGILLVAISSGFCQGDDDPINIEADRMISQEEKNSVVFIGNVDASQGKVTIRTDEMTIYYQPNDPKKAKDQSRQVEKMICVGKVKITQEDWLGTGDRMEYYADARKVILHGNAKTWQGKNMVSGKTITYYLDEKRSEVERAQTTTGKGKKQERVKATIVPNSEKKKK